MSNKGWQRFFELLDKIVDLCTKGQSWKEVAAEVRREANNVGSETNLEEFVSWFEEE